MGTKGHTINQTIFVNLHSVENVLTSELWVQVPHTGLARFPARYIYILYLLHITYFWVNSICITFLFYSFEPFFKLSPRVNCYINMDFM